MKLVAAGADEGPRQSGDADDALDGQNREDVEEAVPADEVAVHDEILHLHGYAEKVLHFGIHGLGEVVLELSEHLGADVGSQGAADRGRRQFNILQRGEGFRRRRGQGGRGQGEGALNLLGRGGVAEVCLGHAGGVQGGFGRLHPGDGGGDGILDLGTRGIGTVPGERRLRREGEARMVVVRFGHVVEAAGAGGTGDCVAVGFVEGVGIAEEPGAVVGGGAVVYADGGVVAGVRHLVASSSSVQLEGGVRGVTGRRLGGDGRVRVAGTVRD
mmetsp:Transcript_8375/g.18295  ORF Transcript_8375/g.18295 Transcript_8375/m.18295 type:complete len:271 (-) Transcript_8375:617-1429(-)